MGYYHIKIRELAYRDQPVLLQHIELQIPHDDFVLIGGKSGCGKTTLLRLLKPQLQGSVRYDGVVSWVEEGRETPIKEFVDKTSAAFIGYVSQAVDGQLISDDIWHELAFGLENLGMESSMIHQRIAETITFLGLEEMMQVPISDLSGGQKQLLNLASVLIMRPKVLLLDEPTSQLDPIAKEHFYDLLLRIHHDYGIGIIMVEHTMESLLAEVDRVIYLEEGNVVFDGAPKQLHQCKLQEDAMLPFPARFVKTHASDMDTPLTMKEMRKLSLSADVSTSRTTSNTIILTCDHLYFRYQKEREDILKDFSLQVHQHEILCLFGGNGSGKTTLLKILGAAQRRPLKEIKAQKRVLYLPQDPRILFLKDSLQEEFAMCCDVEKRNELIHLFELETLLHQHPYDVSGGELQRAALALLLLQVEEEVIFLLDEPSKGLDMASREQLAKIFQTLAKSHSILMVSHDVEMAALCADRCAFLFDGALTSLKDTRTFFLEHQFYTTYWRKCTIGQTASAITFQEVTYDA